MNSALYKKVHQLASSLMQAAEADNEVRFNQLYQELQALCQQNEQSPKNHPVQWETLADFSEDNPTAIRLYNQALVLANSLHEHSYSASISLSLAGRLEEQAEHRAALKAAQAAKGYAAKTQDRELQHEIEQLLARLAKG